MVENNNYDDQDVDDKIKGINNNNRPPRWTRPDKMDQITYAEPVGVTVSERQKELHTDSQRKKNDKNLHASLPFPLSFVQCVCANYLHSASERGERLGRNPGVLPLQIFYKE